MIAASGKAGGKEYQKCEGIQSDQCNIMEQLLEEG